MLLDTFVRFKTLNYYCVHEMMGKLFIRVWGAFFYRSSCSSILCDTFERGTNFCFQIKHFTALTVSKKPSVCHFLLFSLENSFSIRSARVTQVKQNLQTSKEFSCLHIGFLIIMFKNSHTHISVV